MDAQILTIVAIVIIILAALGIWYYIRQRDSERLKQRFGPEYDQAVNQFRSKERAEADLKKREARVRKYEIISLPRAERARYKETWMALQSRFVDQPQAAVTDANELLQEVMERCGYPLANFEQSAADLSVDHPRVVDNYRAAHRIAERNKRGAADTEELRQALVYYRELFQDLLENGDRRDRSAEDRRKRDTSAHEMRRH
jgi:hypothetical protein